MTDTLVKELIEIPSQSGKESVITDFIYRWLSKLNIECYRQGENIVAFIPGEKSNKALILNGHVDTVIEGDADEWKYGPFKATKHEGRVYGLGASDMKAGVAAHMEIAKIFSKKQPPCDLWFSFVVGEEIDGRGTQSFLDWFYLERHNESYELIEGIIGEPTNNEFIGVGHRGNGFVQITVLGEAGHASMPGAIKNNAINQLADICEKIKSLEKDWQVEYRHDYLGVPTIGLTSIESGTTSATNRIPATGKITLDIRTTPLLHGRLNALLRTFVRSLPMNAYYEFISTSPAGWCPENSILRSLFGRYYPQMKHDVMNGSADQCFFSEKGVSCIIFGPGQRDKMHAVNESVELEKIKDHLIVLQDIISRFAQD